MSVEVEVPPAGTEKESILKLIETFTEGWNRHDMVGHFSVFTEDADFVDLDGTLMRGRQKIFEEESNRHIARYSKSNVTVLDVSIRFIRPDVAVVHYFWRMVGAMRPDGTELPPRRGVFTFLTSRRGDRWMLDAAHNTAQP